MKYKFKEGINMFKKFLSVTLSLFLVVSLAACAGGSDTISVSSDDGGQVSSGGGFNANLKSQIQNCTPIVDYAGNTSIDQMDTVTFGLDENSEPIEWIVLEKSNNKALLLSKYVLTSHRYRYNDDNVDITWENCTMRKWINSEYINTIFSKKEQGSIITTDVVNNDNAQYGTNGGNNTKDKIFLLSIDEVKKYFSTDNQRVATFKFGSSYWWLRSPGNEQDFAAYVDSFGFLNEYGEYVDNDHGFRPAMWVRY